MINIFKHKPKPRFYKAVLQPVSNVMKFCYPDRKARKLVLSLNKVLCTDELNNKLPNNGSCPECQKNIWWLLPNASKTARESGKIICECMNCGYQTYL